MDDRTWAQLLGFKFINQNRIDPEDAKIVQELNRLARAFAPHGRCTCVDFNGRRCAGPECPSFQRRILCNASCGDNCCNRGLEAGISVMELELDAIDGVGFVCVAGIDIPPETFICQVLGYIREGVVGRRRRFLHRIEVNSTRPLLIDCTEAGNMTRFLKHSNTPNCVIETWFAGENIVLILKALRYITRNEVLTVKLPQMAPDYDPFELAVDAYPAIVHPRPRYAAVPPPTTPRHEASAGTSSATPSGHSPAIDNLRRISEPVRYRRHFTEEEQVPGASTSGTSGTSPSSSTRH